NLGAMYEQMGRYQEAIKVFEASNKNRPTAQAYSNLGTCYYFLGRYSDSAAAFDHSVALAPTKYIYWANLGDAYRWIPEQEAKASPAYAQAIELRRRELRINPTDAITRARLAECLAKRGDAKSANAEIERAIKTDPKSGRIFYKAAVVAAVGGDETKAVRRLT